MTLIKNIQNPQNKKTDAQLVHEYKRTLNNQIIGEFYNRYSHIVFGISLKYIKDTELAQDAMLDVFNNLFEQIVKYKIDDFKSWLLTVTRNHCLKLLKEMSKTAPLEYANTKNLTVDFMETEHEIDLINAKEKQLQLLEVALTKLKPVQQQCVSLFYIENKSYHEIAELTRYDIKKVKSYIQNGKRNLQIIMNKLEESSNNI